MTPQDPADPADTTNSAGIWRSNTRELIGAPQEAQTPALAFEPTTTPPPVSGVATAPGAPANDAPPADLAAGDDEGWEPLE